MLRTEFASLRAALANTLHDSNHSAEERLRRAVDLLQVAEVIKPEAGASCRGGLAPWRMRKVIEHIQANLDASIKVDELAAVVRLGTSHFSRVFRVSFGQPPHGYIVRKRMERAQELMLSTDASLGQIALDCGLSDQAHFSRLFRKFCGESPGTWRRARIGADV